MLLHAGAAPRAPSADAAGALWYPLWDAGFVLGHRCGTVKEALALADDELDALTALLDVRLVARRRRARRRAGRRECAGSRRDAAHGWSTTLAAAAAERLVQPGPIAEMLEPNLKDGAGGLRDVQAPGWVGWALPAGGPPGTTRRG